MVQENGGQSAPLQWNMVARQFLVEAAADVRRRSGLTVPSFSTKAIVDACFPNAVVTGRVLPIGFNEVVARTPEGPIIIYSRSMPIAKQRLAIAHAVAHLLFDDDDSCCRPGFVGDDNVEDRADNFARELLVPLEDLKALVQRWPSNDNAAHEVYLDHVDELASFFNVPPYVIDERIRELVALA
jgi:Zn-dependent peptidase ImmA (M78 family)